MSKITYFHSKGCKPCKDMDEIMRKVKKSGVNVTKVDVDSKRGSDFAEKARVHLVPTLIIEKAGSKKRVTGVPTERKLKKLI